MYEKYKLGLSKHCIFEGKDWALSAGLDA